MSAALADITAGRRRSRASLESHPILFSKRRRDSDHAPPLPSPPPAKSMTPSPATPSSSASSSSSATASSSSQEIATTTSTANYSKTLVIHFFVRITNSKTLVLHASPHDTVASVLGHLATSGCGRDLRLLLSGRQLQPESTLAAAGVSSDSELHLSSRLRSTIYPRAWQLASNIAFTASSATAFSLNDLVKDFFSDAISTRPTDQVDAIGFGDTKDNITDQVADYLEIFLHAGATVALVKLYLSKSTFLRTYAESAIRCFLSPDPVYLPREAYLKCAPVLAEFCRLLAGTAGRRDPLYVACRGALAAVLAAPEWRPTCTRRPPASVIEQVLPFAQELAEIVMEGMAVSVSLPMPTAVSSRDLAEFSSFLLVLRREAMEWMGHQGPMPRDCYNNGPAQRNNWIYCLHAIFADLLKKVNECLKKFEMDLSLSSENKVTADSSESWAGRSQILVVLSELDLVSEIFGDVPHDLRLILLARQGPLNALIRCAKRNVNLHWFWKHKDLLGFEARRNLVLMMLPDGKDDYGELHEMLIDRSHLLAESFEYITQAKASDLRGGLFMEFKNEEATGPGVLREWFCMVCHALFSPQHVLFLPCPNDKRRFFLNPTSAIDPLHLKYFTFSGRVIALALMHKVQVGIVFDRILFLQLAGTRIALEDIRDADPCLYASCKKILEMDADLLDSDTLGLTFVRETEELGSRKVIQLCPGGKDIAVNSKNRGHYIDLLIQDRFVNSISVQLIHFAQGFSDILVDSSLQKIFFKSLDVEDFDRMLGGNDSIINVGDWKSHTEYNGYKEKDHQIFWFWKVVERMPIEQQRQLLFFWTSVKYLPADGFCGLGSKLYIYRTSDSHDRLPSSHTCFYRLCLPPYSSISMMQSRLQMITQEHVSCSFGTW